MTTIYLPAVTAEARATMTAILAAIIVFILTLVTSWAATAGLRKIPGVAQVL